MPHQSKSESEIEDVSEEKRGAQETHRTDKFLLSFIIK